MTPKRYRRRLRPSAIPNLTNTDNLGMDAETVTLTFSHGGAYTPDGPRGRRDLTDVGVDVLLTLGLNGDVYARTGVWEGRVEPAATITVQGLTDLGVAAVVQRLRMRLPGIRFVHITVDGLVTWYDGESEEAPYVRRPSDRR